jgi:hypothetical protein
MSFERSVFVNCPFDDDYRPLFRALLFTVLKLGFEPRTALDRNDSGESRLEKIKQLILESKYSIHDLSRAQAKKKGEYFRLNMPFELGLDYGCREYHADDRYRTKCLLILEKDRYATQKALSDMNATDCMAHYGDAQKLISAIRNWFSGNGFHDLPSATVLWTDFNMVQAKIYADKIESGFSQPEIDELPVPEFILELKRNLF